MLKFNKPTLITITAPTCSGKNFLMEALQTELNFNRIVSTTTREKRDGEIEGVDYYFISELESVLKERDAQFAELVTFRGTRYGVTHTEMNGKMSGPNPPMVILEPNGVEIYEKMCIANGWDIFKIYIHTVESVRLERLLNRTIKDFMAAATVDAGNKVLKTHIDRTLSIVGDERRWSQSNSWNAIIPGDNIKVALAMVEYGIAWRNKRNTELEAKKQTANIEMPAHQCGIEV